MGKAIPTQDKLRVLADWLQVSPDALRFGLGGVANLVKDADGQFENLNLADREMLSRYLALSVAERKTVRDVVEALSVAATVKKVE